MGKLNIAHHKSYHPYRRDNIEKVRRDEEEAREKEAKEDGRMMLADSEARIDRLRERAGSSKKKKAKDDDDMKALASSSFEVATLASSSSGGHINLFEDLEQNAVATAVRSTKKAETTETDKGFPLAPPAKDLKPWYSDRGRTAPQADAIPDDRMKRDMARKSIHDPLTSITHQLASSSKSSSSLSSKSYRSRPPPPSSSHPPEVSARIARESSERERALALIARKKRESRMSGSETPSVRGDADAEYGDMYNRVEVQEAHRGRDRRWDDGDQRKRGGRERYW